MVVLANPKPENLWNSGAVVCIEACICVCSAGIWAPGGFGMATGLTFADEPVFGNESDAMDYLEENCQKWEDAIAVKYKDGSSLVTP